MFQFPGFASNAYGFSARYPIKGGLPHSDIHGSKPARGSPWLFAACHVLHRLLVPRHPPNALLMLKTTHARKPSPAPTLRFSPKTPPQRPSLIQHTTVSPLNTAPPRAGLTTHRSDVQRPSPETHQNLIHPDKDHIRPHGLTPHGRNRSRRPLPEAAGTRFPFFFHCMRQSPRALPAGKTLSSPRPLWPKTGPATGWWRRSGSNRRPPACKAGALPAELRPQLVPHRPNQIDRQMASQAK